MAKSYRGHYRNFEPFNHKHFIMENFEFTAHCNSRFNSVNSNMLACIQGSFAEALNACRMGISPSIS